LNRISFQKDEAMVHRVAVSHSFSYWNLALAIKVSRFHITGLIDIKGVLKSHSFYSGTEFPTSVGSSSYSFGHTKSIVDSIISRFKKNSVKKGTNLEHIIFRKET
jgi:hypothetical protein